MFSKCICHLIVFVLVFLVVFLLVRSRFLITLSTSFKHRSLKVFSRCHCHCHCLCHSLSFVDHVMFHHHSEQMSHSQKSQAWMCSKNVFVFVTWNPQPMSKTSKRFVTQGHSLFHFLSKASVRTGQLRMPAPPKRMNFRKNSDGGSFSIQKFILQNLDL